MDGVKISVNKEGKVEKPVKKRGRPKKVAKKVPAKASVTKTQSNSKVSQKTIEKSKKSKKGGFVSMLISMIITAVIVGGVIYAWQSRSGKKGINDVRQEARQVRLDFDQRLKQLKNKLTGVETENQKLKDSTKELEERIKLLDGAKKDFSDPEIGISFEYPAIFGEVELEMFDGSTGKKFKATFSKNKSLVFGGVSVDFEAKASTTKIDFLDSQGYYAKKDKFYFQTIGMSDSDEIELMPIKELGKNGDVLLIDKTSFAVEEETNLAVVDIGENIGAIANLKIDNFQGLSFLNQDLNVMPPESFENLLFSIESKKINNN